MSSKRYEYLHERADGTEPTKCFVQEILNSFGGKSYALVDHPENKGRHVFEVSRELGDALIRRALAADPQFIPSNLSLYCELPRLGEDGEIRFARLQAKTIEVDRNGTPSRWDWNDGFRMNKVQAERALDTKLETFNKPPLLPEHMRPINFESESIEPNSQLEQLREAAKPPLEIDR